MMDSTVLEWRWAEPGKLYPSPPRGGGKLRNKDEVTWLKQCERESGTGIESFVLKSLAFWQDHPSVINRLETWVVALCLGRGDWIQVGYFSLFWKAVAGANFLRPVIQLLIAVSLLFGVTPWIAMMLCCSKTIQTLCCLVQNSYFRLSPAQRGLLSMTKCQGLTASVWEACVSRCDLPLAACKMSEFRHVWLLSCSPGIYAMCRLFFRTQKVISPSVGDKGWNVI